jgi:hypothetical protein
MKSSKAFKETTYFLKGDKSKYFNSPSLKKAMEQSRKLNDKK